ncbi:hypothetical protein EXS70_01335 [Candidatus Peribacteria bacterium]|nr:hypothetical protein [Candidatus Peribacteria bacterium]
MSNNGLIGQKKEIHALVEKVQWKGITISAKERARVTRKVSDEILSYMNVCRVSWKEAFFAIAEDVATEFCLRKREAIPIKDRESTYEF